MTTKTTIKKPSDAAVKKAKAALVKEVGLLFLNEIESATRDFEDFPLTTSGKSDIKDPTAVINIRYIGEWRYCPQRKRLHLTGSVPTLLNRLVEKYTERYTKFIIEWSTDERAWVTITIKNKQPATLAILNGGLSPSQQKAADKVAKDLEIVKGVADELEHQLRNCHPFGSNNGNIAREWRRTNDDEGKAVVEIEIRQYGDYEYMDECGKFNGHEDYFMSAETFSSFKETLATVGKKHPKVDISWHESGKEWVSIYLEMKGKAV